MTGYASASSSFEGADLDVTIRAVNGRFLEVRCHLPREYLSLESEIKKIVSTEFRRGTIDIYVNRRFSESSRCDVSVRSDMAKRWVKALQKLQREIKIKDKLKLDTLIQLPQVTEIVEDRSVSESESKHLLQLLKDCASSCVKEKAREGEALGVEIRKLFVDLKAQIDQMDRLRDQAQQDLRARFQEKLKRLELPTEVSEPRVQQEIAIWIDRTDIDEELVRLKEHLSACDMLLNCKESVGKKLDFYCQELLRETNTIGAKSQLAVLTTAVINSKSIIERIKEQVQNLE